MMKFPGGRRIDVSGWCYKIQNYYRVIFNIKVLVHLVRLKLYMRGVDFGKNIRFTGFPLVHRVPDSKIKIGDNCMFNSSRHSQPIGIYRPCAFVTLNKGAEIIIGKNSGATGVSIVASRNVTIGNNVIIGAFCTLIDNDFHNPDPNKRKTIVAKPIVIEDNVFLGFNCFVLKGVTIGKNSVIGANSVVISNIPPNSFAMGNPCKIIVERDW